MIKKYVVGSTEKGEFFVRRVDTKTVSQKKAYPVLPTSRKHCIEKVSELARTNPSVLILHDGLCGTDATHQDCIKLIIEALNRNEDVSSYGNSELLEFHDSENTFQFVVSRHDLSKAMLDNNDRRTVDTLMDDYYSDYDEAINILNMLSLSTLCFYRDITNK